MLKRNMHGLAGLALLRRRATIIEARSLYKIISRAGFCPVVRHFCCSLPLILLHVWPLARACRSGAEAYGPAMLVGVLKPGV